jgi:hypothetical protein
MDRFTEDLCTASVQVRVDRRATDDPSQQQPRQARRGSFHWVDGAVDTTATASASCKEATPPPEKGGAPGTRNAGPTTVSRRRIHSLRVAKPARDTNPHPI